MALNESAYPDDGIITVSWRSVMVEGRRRLHWSYESSPSIHKRLSIDLLADVLQTLEEDLADLDETHITAALH